MKEPGSDNIKKSKKKQKKTFSDSQWKVITGFFGSLLVNFA